MPAAQSRATSVDGASASGSRRRRAAPAAHADRDAQTQVAVGQRQRCSVITRAEWNCRLCGIHGEAANEFSGVSPHAQHAQVVIARGSQDKPRGPECLKCLCAWAIGGWREEYNDDIDKFYQEKMKDDTVNDCWMECTSLWLEAHNSGRRIREVKSDKYSKRHGGKDSVFNQIRMKRENRKRVLKRTTRTLRAKEHLKFLTPTAYQDRYKRTLEDDGLVAGWHMVKKQKRFGVIINMTPEGEVDLEHEDAEAVEEEEEIESGEDELRPQQADAKFNHVAGGLDATLAAAVRVSLEASSGGSQHRAQTASLLDSGSDDDSDGFDFDSGVMPGLVKLSGAVIPTVSASRPATSSAASSGKAKPAAKQRTGAAVTSTGGPPRAQEAPPQLIPNGLDDELKAINFSDLEQKVSSAVSVLYFGQLDNFIIDLQVKAALQQGCATCSKSLNEAIGKMAQAEHTLKRRSAVNEEALDKVSSLKKFSQGVVKLLAALTAANLGGVCVESLEAAIASTTFSALWTPPLAVRAATILCRTLNKAKYNRWSDLKEFLDLNTGRLATSLAREDNQKFNRHMGEVCLGKAAPRVGRNCRTAPELLEQLAAVAEV